MKASPGVLLCLLLATASLIPLSSSALVMRENGPEPVILEIKESLRKSDSLDADLASLAQVQRLHGVSVEQRWAGVRYLERIGFPADFSRERAQAVIATLQQLPYVEKVVPTSAFNLHYKAVHFVRGFAPGNVIPEAAKRGLDAHRLNRNPADRGAVDLSAPHQPNRLIVSWKREHVWRGERTGFFQRVASFNAAAGCRVVNEYRWSDTELVQVLEFDSKARPLSARLQRYNSSEWVEYAEPDYVQTSFGRVEPDDQFFQNQRVTLDLIRAPEAWGTGIVGSENWRIAVADSGVVIDGSGLPSLTDLRNETGNYSFASAFFQGSDLSDVHPGRHGTRVASIIGAQGNNFHQMTGVAWDVKLMHLKVARRSGDDTVYDSGPAAEAIRYAWDTSFAPGRDASERAIAINMSFGNPVPTESPNETYRGALKTARDQNLVAVCAAGQRRVEDGGGYNLDARNQLGGLRFISPACIPTDNVISVGGINSADTDRDPISNYGHTQIDLGAPSQNVLGLDGSGVSGANGTSFAAPQVAGAVALIKTKYPWESYSGLRDRVLMGVEEKNYLAGVFRTGGILNVEKALLPRTVIQNLSTRARVEDGDRVMIAGFVIGGTMRSDPPPPQLRILIRGLGPSLPVSRPLGNPKIELYRESTWLDENDNWESHPSAGEVAAIGFGPGNSLESAMIKSLDPGAYTVIVRDAGSASGVGLVELYELANAGAESQESRLLNVSTRCIVGFGEESAIAGSIVGNPRHRLPPDNPDYLPSEKVPKRRVLMLGNGPVLQYLGIASGFLPNPFLEVFNSVGESRGQNDRWEEIDGDSVGLEYELSENGWQAAPGGDKPYRPEEAALWPTFSTGESFTAVLSPAGGSGPGIGLIEFYEY